MRPRIRQAFVVPIGAALLMAAALTAAAAEPPASIEVTALAAERSGDAVTVTGTAVFGGQQPLLVGEDPTGDAPIRPEAAAFGLDVTELAIHRPDPGSGELEFTIRVTELSAEPPPEVVRYLWQMKVDGEEYWIQAKTSDISTATAFLDDPQGTLEHIPGSFRLRGNCGFLVPDAETVATCQHLAWIDGVFDTEANEVRMTVPLGLEVAPHFTPGARITAGEVNASFQLVVSNATTSDAVVQDVDYAIPDKAVRIGIVPAGTDPGGVPFTTSAALADDGSFGGDLDVGALGPGDYEVFARACFADNCGVRGVPVTIE
ncbi:MAG: hypothetical protein GEV04_15820 [Actinophytocola sp.]|nr:hypothetical protein [Actinophytocola sp.]